MLEGDKFTVILFGGKPKPLFTRLDLTLSLDSFMAISGSPTMLKLGSPFEISNSTVIFMPSTPRSPALFISKNIFSYGVIFF